MGMYSWKCKHCGEPISSTGSPDIVAVLPPMKGKYSGYGCIEDSKGNTGALDVYRRKEGDSWNHGEPDVYHAECYGHYANPPTYQGGSEVDPEQGWGDDAW